MLPQIYIVASTFKLLLHLVTDPRTFNATCYQSRKHSNSYIARRWAYRQSIAALSRLANVPTHRRFDHFKVQEGLCYETPDASDYPTDDLTPPPAPRFDEPARWAASESTDVRIFDEDDNGDPITQVRD